MSDVATSASESRVTAPTTRLSDAGMVAGLLLAMSLLPFWYASERWVALNDDSYITLTFAKNLAAGNGFVYNHPPATFGTTTPFLTLVAALLALALPWWDMTRSVTWFTALCWVGIPWTLFAFRKALRLNAWEVLLIGAMVISTSNALFLGMEAFLFQFLFVLVFVLAHTKRWLLCGIACGLLYLTRGEGALVGPCVALVFGIHGLAVERWRLRQFALMCWDLLLGAAFPVTLWSVYALMTFGHVFPDTLSAKQAYLMTFRDRNFSEVWWEWSMQFGLYPGRADPNLWYPLWGFFAFGVIEIVARRPRWLMFILFLAAYILGYSLLGVMAFHWYALPMYFVWQVCVALGLCALLRRLFEVSGPWRLHARLSGVLAAVLLTVLPAYAHIESSPEYIHDPRAVSYRRVCDWLSENAESDASVAMSEVGYLGYFTDLRVVDLAGLVTPGIIPNLAKGDKVSGFWEHEPDYYVWFEGDGFWAAINHSPGFARTYQPVARITGPEPRPATLIYRRESLHLMDTYPAFLITPRGVMRNAPEKTYRVAGEDFFHVHPVRPNQYVFVRNPRWQAYSPIGWPVRGRNPGYERFDFSG